MFRPLLLFVLLPSTVSHWTDELDLPPRLLEYQIRNRKDLKRRCMADPECPFDNGTLNNGRCWGHEPHCQLNESYSADLLSCNLPSEKTKKWSKEQLQQRFFEQGDWRYVHGEGRSNMHEICISKDQDRSSLTCSDHLAYCTARNIFFDFANLRAQTSSRYRDDVIREGQAGGNCEEFRMQILKDHIDRQSYLQSWGAELKHFRPVSDFVVDDDHCDVIFDRPTIVIKLDAAINMFHHFCDFINLYASQHMNGTNFDTDVDVLWWDTAPKGFVDAYFGTTWSVFSRNKPVELIALDGKKVCFRNALLPLLARQRFGMYYNMPVTGGCQGSGLVHAFAHHILHRLRVPQHGPVLNKVRVTILSRSTAHRKILNEKELLARLHAMEDVEARIVDYNGRVPFLSQLESTHNSDVFIGMHGSGLTHLLFLPDWAAVFEIYNCDDENCYYDLARLRGVRYKTWSNMSLVKADGEGRHPSLGTPHAKFTSYTFDGEEFERIVRQLVEYVRRHPLFVKEQRRLRREEKMRETNERGTVGGTVGGTVDGGDVDIGTDTVKGEL